MEIHSKLIQTKDYLLLIDEEAKIFQMDYYIDDDCNTVTRATLSSNQYKGCKKVIAYYPLSKDAQELDLPLLPVTPKNEWKVHEKHCCNKHGCKYGDNNCCVELGITKQRYPCEDCNDEDQKFSLEDIKQVIKLTLEDAKKICNMVRRVLQASI